MNNKQIQAREAAMAAAATDFETALAAIAETHSLSTAETFAILTEYLARITSLLVNAERQD